MSNKPEPKGVVPPPGFHWDPNAQGESTSPGDRGAYVTTIHIGYKDTIQQVWYPGWPYPTAQQEDRYVTINGHKTLAGYYDYSHGRAGTWTPFTQQELQDHVKQETGDAQKQRDKAAQKAGFRNEADQKAQQQKTGQNTTAGAYDPNAANVSKGGSPWDNLTNTSRGDYSNSKITTSYTDLGQLPGSYLLPQTDLTQKQDTYQNLLKEFANSGKDNISKVQQELINAGLGNNVSATGLADSNTLAAYSGLLQNALLLQSGGQKITPDELLTGLAKSAKPKTTTSTAVTLTNRAQAQQALESAFADKLGRRPTDAEVAAFQQAINSYEQANPATTTTTTDASGNSVTSQKTIDPGTGSASFVSDYASNYAQTNPATAGEFHAAQALDFYNLALSTLAGGGISTGNTT
jgi:hypothetical protein